MTKAIMIPWDDNEPIIEVNLKDDPFEQMEGLIFGPVSKGATQRTLGSATMGRGVQCFHDDEGMFNSPFDVNVRAMKLWAHVSGRKLSDFRQPLWGNFVVYGYDEAGESTDVPAIVTDFFSEEGVVGA
jgi:hypothetical protein